MSGQCGYSPYTGVETPVYVDRNTGVKRKNLGGLGVLGRSVEGLNRAVVVLVERLLNNRNTGRTGLDGPLDLSLGLNMVQHADVRAMRI